MYPERPGLPAPGPDTNLCGTARVFYTSSRAPLKGFCLPRLRCDTINGDPNVRVVYAFFRSTRLAVILSLILAALSAISTFIPQGRDPAFYASFYPPAAARVIISTGYSHFFTSWLFLFPAALFMCNLIVCSAGRFAEELRGRKKKRYGQDIIHLGILLLLAGFVLTGFTRREALVYAARGDHVLLPGGGRLVVESFEYQVYEDGRPKDWITSVSILRAGEEKKYGGMIEVNRPLKAGDVKIYQSSFREVVRYGTKGPETVMETGLLIKKEQGFILVFSAFIVICTGLMVTFLQKGRDGRR